MVCGRCHPMSKYGISTLCRLWTHMSIVVCTASVNSLAFSVCWIIAMYHLKANCLEDRVSSGQDNFMAMIVVRFYISVLTLNGGAQSHRERTENLIIIATTSLGADVDGKENRRGRAMMGFGIGRVMSMGDTWHAATSSRFGPQSTAAVVCERSLICIAPGCLVSPPVVWSSRSAFESFSPAPI